MKFMFQVRLKPGYQAADYARAWVAASRLIQQAPGALGTELHRKLDDPNELLAIARWDSKASRDAMEQQPNERIKAIIQSAAPYVDITPLGEFAEPDWVIGPGGTVEKDATPAS